VEQSGALLNSLGKHKDTEETGGEEREDDPKCGLADMRVVNVFAHRGGLPSVSGLSD